MADSRSVVNAGERESVEAVVFDIGGVLLDWNPRHLYRKVFDDEAAMERFLSRICTPKWHDSHDRGTNTAESCDVLARAHPEYADEIWAWSTRSEEMVGGELRETIGVLTELKAAGVACYALSNMEVETFSLRRRRFDFFGLFDGIVISGIEGVAKPDLEIFELLLDRFGLEPTTTLFIDDSPGNLAPAAALGMVTLLYEGPGHLHRFLRALDLLPEGSAAGGQA